MAKQKSSGTYPTVHPCGDDFETMTEKHIIAAVAFVANDKGAADRGVRLLLLYTIPYLYIRICMPIADPFSNIQTYCKVQLQDVASRAKRTTSR